MYFTLVNLKFIILATFLILLISCTIQKIEKPAPYENIINNINNIVLNNSVYSIYKKDKNWDNGDIINILNYEKKVEIFSLIEIQKNIESKNVEPSQLMKIILNSYKDNTDLIKRAYIASMLYVRYPEMRLKLFPILYESFNYHSPPYLYVISYDDFNNYIKKIYDMDEEISIELKLLLGYFLSKKIALTSVKNNTQPVSVAAIFRTAYLNFIFKNSGIDTMQLLEEFHNYEDQVGDNEVYKFEYNLFSNDNTKRLEAEKIIFGVRETYFSFCNSANGLDFPYCQGFKDLDKDDAVKAVKMYLFQRRAIGRLPFNHEMVKSSFLPNDQNSSRVQTVVSLAILSHKNFEPDLH